MGASDTAFRAGRPTSASVSPSLSSSASPTCRSSLVLWLLYMSFVHVGQIFYGYGWEILLLETGFLAVFLAPALATPVRFPAERRPRRS